MTDNNSKLFDLMDTINQIAKGKGYTNGISWAREALEKKTIDQLTFNAFEKCHTLRNLMGHGCASDIQISDKTLENANAFYEAIAPSQPVTPSQATPPKAEEKPAPQQSYHAQRSPIRLGDYVIMMWPERYYWGTFSAQSDEIVPDQQTFQRGYLFRVKDAELNGFFVDDLEEIKQPPLGWWAKKSTDIYIFRTTEMFDYCFDDWEIFVIDQPKVFEKDGKPFITFQYAYGKLGQRDSVELNELTCEGYKATVETFEEGFPYVCDSDGNKIDR